MRAFQGPLPAFVTALAICSCSHSSPSADAGAPADAPLADVNVPPDGMTDAGSGDGGSPNVDAGPTGSCVVRPACETCVTGDAGVCCVYPNPNPPPGPENAIACALCPADAGAKFVTLACNNESDCPKAQVCCISAEQPSSVRSFCAAACNPLKHEVGLCDANTTKSVCPPTSPCSRNNIDDWNLPHCYGTCGGVAP